MSQSQATSYDSSDSNHISQSLTIIVIVPNLHNFCTARADPLSEPQPS